MSCGQVTPLTLTGGGGVSPVTCCAAAAAQSTSTRPGVFIAIDYQNAMGQHAASQIIQKVPSPPSTPIPPVTNPSPTGPGFVASFIDKPVFVTNMANAVRNTAGAVFPTVITGQMPIPPILVDH